MIITLSRGMLLTWGDNHEQRLFDAISSISELFQLTANLGNTIRGQRFLLKGRNRWPTRPTS